MNSQHRMFASLLAVALLLSLWPAAAAGRTDTLAATDSRRTTRPGKVDSQVYTLRLGALSFDGHTEGPDLPTGWDSVHSAGPDLHLVQLVGPTRDAWLDDLEAAGLEIVQYIYPFTYVVWAEQSALENVVTADFVRWTGPFAPAYRVLPKWRQLSDRPYRVDVLLYRGADVDAALESIGRLGGLGVGRKVLNDVFEIAGFVISGAQLRAASQVPGVYTIQVEATDGGLRGEMSDQVNANNVDEDNRAIPGYLAWLGAAGVDGNGVIIANVDGGIQDTHPDLVNRIIACEGETCGGGASSDHGTHTAGIMAADGSSGVLDPYGFLRGLGMAPGANLVEQVYTPWYGFPGGMLMLMTDSYNNGASLSGNSWGPSGSPLGYDDDTMQVDIGVRDADPDAPGNQPLSYVLSIMNGNGGYQTQGTPDEAKNIFTIGSTKMQNSDGSQILEINDLSANTAHGPALDGRSIPHMVAPGCNVDSTVTGNGYALFCGTSMASPHVSGAVALFIEFYRNLFGLDPSPALIKAAFLPVAHDLAGNADADGNPLGHPFDSKQGWGRMDVAAVVSPTLAVQYFDSPLIFDNTGEEWVQTLSVADSTQPLRLMLVWTDAPGHGLGGDTPAWNNDLDLLVESGDETYRGNYFGSDGWSLPGGSADPMNNTEGVFLGPTASGAVSVHVMASNINSDGIPNQGDETDQDFALVCYNCLTQPDFQLSATPDQLELCTPGVISYTIQVRQILTYPYPVELVLESAPLGITAHLTPTLVIPDADAQLTLQGSLSATLGAHIQLITGTAQLTNVKVLEVPYTVNTTPAAPPLTAPPDGATVDTLVPTLQWQPTSPAASYDLELADAPSFAQPVFSATGIITAHFTLPGALNPFQRYYWRVRGVNSCGASAFSHPFAFDTPSWPCILLVDDDGGSTAESAYTAALDALGISYHLFTVPSSTANGPDPSTLIQYPIVLWFTGSRFSHTLTSADRAALSAYLDGGGALLLSGWGVGGDLDGSAFLADTLHAAYQGDVFGGDISLSGAGFLADYPLTVTTLPGQQISKLSPLGGATAVYDLPAPHDSPAALAYDGDYDLVYLGFGLESVSDPASRQAALQAILDWLGPCAVPPPTPSFVSSSPDLIGSPTTFTNTTVGAQPISYAWDFGDGVGTSTAEHPVYTYTQVGSYTVWLTATNAGGSAAVSDTVEITGTPPVAGFSHSAPVFLGSPVVFTNTTTPGQPPQTSYLWDFGDEVGASTAEHPVYTYTQVGTYTVWLSAANLAGSDAISATVRISEPPQPQYRLFLPLMLSSGDS